ncbi:MAG TPA: flagellar hook-basal body complex protein FliE [Deltaproteobacteria bacterium]|nr:flagellar hook-basal body complex protein FliE [Deltaproteobacteria bacterium]
MMRIDPSDFTHLSTNLTLKDSTKGKQTDFSDTLRDIIRETNTAAKESEKIAVDLAQGKSTNIHEAMVSMQKADISIRLLISATNKLIAGYNQLMQLR